MAKPSTAAYQRHRKDTLRGHERKRVRDVAAELMRENRRRGFHYSRGMAKALQGKRG